MANGNLGEWQFAAYAFPLIHGAQFETRLELEMRNWRNSVPRLSVVGRMLHLSVVYKTALRTGTLLHN